MSIPVWSVMEWDGVKTTPEKLQGAASLMEVLSVSEDDECEAGRRKGQVLWCVETPEGCLGLAWEWVELQRDVVVMLDPMTVLSNALLVDQRGERIDHSWRIVYLNNAVHAIPWQRAVTENRRTANRMRRQRLSTRQLCA